MKTSDPKNLFHFYFQPRNDRLKSTFQALLIRVNNGEDGEQWFLKTYLASLNSNGNTGGSLGTTSQTKRAQVKRSLKISVSTCVLYTNNNISIKNEREAFSIAFLKQYCCAIRMSTKHKAIRTYPFTKCKHFIMLVFENESEFFMTFYFRFSIAFLFFCHNYSYLKCFNT